MDRFGLSVSITSGSYGASYKNKVIAVGAPYEDSDGVGDNNNLTNSGAVYLFEPNSPYDQYER